MTLAYLFEGQSLNVDVISFALGAAVRDHDGDRALVGVRIAVALQLQHACLSEHLCQSLDIKAIILEVNRFYTYIRILNAGCLSAMLVRKQQVSGRSYHHMGMHDKEDSSAGRYGKWQGVTVVSLPHMDPRSECTGSQSTPCISHFEVRRQPPALGKFLKGLFSCYLVS